MYGQYSELQRFARDFASKSSFRREQEQHRQPLTIEEAKRRKSLIWRELLASFYSKVCLRAAGGEGKIMRIFGKGMEIIDVFRTNLCKLACF